MARPAIVPIGRSGLRSRRLLRGGPPRRAGDRRGNAGGAPPVGGERHSAAEAARTKRPSNASLARVVRHIRPAAHRVCVRMKGANCGAILSRSPIRSHDPGNQRPCRQHPPGDDECGPAARLGVGRGNRRGAGARITAMVIADHIDKRMGDAGVGALGGLLAGTLVGAVICDRSDSDCVGDMAHTGGSMGLGIGALALFPAARTGGRTTIRRSSWRKRACPSMAGEKMLTRLARTTEGRAGRAATGNSAWRWRARIRPMTSASRAGSQTGARSNARSRPA